MDALVRDGFIAACQVELDPWFIQGQHPPSIYDATIKALPNLCGPMAGSNRISRGEPWTTLAAVDGHRIRVRCWTPRKAGQPGGVVQVLHGLGEHIGRYDRFAAACTEKGLAVVGHDHRGHGADCDVAALGHFADHDGWNKVVADAIAVQRLGVATWPGIRTVLFGHSMGSFIAQSVLAREHGQTNGLVLSASTLTRRSQLRLGRMLARLVVLRSGGRAKSPLLNRLGIGNLNKRFAPATTPFDWLSRDEVEVDRYIADPLCGFPLSNRLWYDLLGGMLEVMALRTLRRIPSSMPVLVTGGESDPLGGWRGQGRLAEAFVNSRHADVELKLYPDARHEMLHETNRDEFMRNVLRWIERRVNGFAEPG